MTLFHADDQLEPTYVALRARGHQAHPGAVAVYPQAPVVDATGKRLVSPPDLMKRFTSPRRRGDVTVLEGDDGLASLLWGQHIFCPAVSYKRSLLGPEPFDRRWRQVLDLDLLARLLLDGQQLVGLHEVGYVYRRARGAADVAADQGLHPLPRGVRGLRGDRREGEGRRLAAHNRVAEQARILKAHVLYRSLALLLHGDASSAHAALRFLRHRNNGAHQTNP